MKITFLTPNLVMTGGNVVMRRYAEHLAGRGHQVGVVAAGDRSEYILNSVHYRCVPYVVGKYVDLGLVGLPLLGRMLRAVGSCDLVIPVFFPFVVHALRAKRTGRCKRVVVLFQDYFEMRLFGSWNRILLKRKRVTAAIDEFVFVSSGIAEEVRKLEPSIGGVVVPNGISDEFLAPVGRGERTRAVLFVGARNKGLDLFLSVARELRRRLSEVPEFWIVARDVDTTVDGVRLLKPESESELAALYRQVLVFLSTSPGDSFGLPALEAMAGGAAVAMSATAGSRQFARDGENCLRFRPGSIREASDAVAKLLADPPLCERLSRAGAATARSYTWNRSLEGFREIVEQADREPTED